MFDPNLPIPSTDFLTDKQLIELFNIDYKSSVTFKDLKQENKKENKTSNPHKRFGGKFKDGIVRDKFLSFINERIIGYGVTQNEKIPLLIPFEIRT